ncbi:Ferm domain-containing protein b [Plakobranchus ocellatus]|uniref:Ferm domain-containing protein b n=1 Tax=Plakobranchus ocellatus TaxID=259542 RepID=A0AAV3Z5Y7_9GAST|nr:Ferm domain-containing protein b [Plakobranchus ocellatus]
MQRLIVDGDLPCTKDEAATLAGIQLHIQETWPETPDVPSVGHDVKTGRDSDAQSKGRNGGNHNHHTHQQQHSRPFHPHYQTHHLPEQQQQQGSKAFGVCGDSPALDSDDEDVGGGGGGVGGDLTRCFRINTDSDRLENLRHKKELIRSRRAQRITRYVTE